MVKSLAFCFQTYYNEDTSKQVHWIEVGDILIILKGSSQKYNINILDYFDNLVLYTNR